MNTIINKFRQGESCWLAILTAVLLVAFQVGCGSRSYGGAGTIGGLPGAGGGAGSSSDTSGVSLNAGATTNGVTVSAAGVHTSSFDATSTSTGTGTADPTSITDTAQTSCAWSTDPGAATVNSTHSSATVDVIVGATPSCPSGHENACILCTTNNAVANNGSTNKNTAANATGCSIACTGIVPSNADYIVATNTFSLYTTLTATFTTNAPDPAEGMIRFDATVNTTSSGHWASDEPALGDPSMTTIACTYTGSTGHDGTNDELGVSSIGATVAGLTASSTSSVDAIFATIADPTINETTTPCTVANQATTCAATGGLCDANGFCTGLETCEVSAKYKVVTLNLGETALITPGSTVDLITETSSAGNGSATFQATFCDVAGGDCSVVP